MKNYKELARQLLELDARNGLPEDIFLAASTLMPVANVDLLIRDEWGRVLLSWRNDDWFEKAWHIPGGCIRFKETMLERVQKTAMQELHTHVIVESQPVAVRDVIDNKDSKTHKIRAHHLAVLYECRLPDGYKIDNGLKSEEDAGYLKWFEKMPDNLLRLHDCYRDIFIQKGLIE